MTLGSRAKLALILGGFALPIVASFLVYTFGHPKATANYGELLLPPETVSAGNFTTAAGAGFRFRELEGRWILLTAQRGACDDDCRTKLVAIRQVRLALGREADRVSMVTLAEGPDALAPALREAFPGMVFVVSPQAAAARGPAGDPAHIYLVDPHGNVMMRWPSRPDFKRMKGDLDRLLKASQIG